MNSPELLEVAKSLHEIAGVMGATNVILIIFLFFKRMG